jgi:hypothetical protein
MDSQTRRVIAYIAARIFTGKTTGYIFDYSTGSYANMSGQVSDSRVNIFDYSVSNYISGNSSGNSFNLFNYHTSSYVQLKMDGNKFNGFDYSSSNYYSGTVSDNGAVSFFDYGTGQYYNYKV